MNCLSPLLTVNNAIEMLEKPDIENNVINEFSTLKMGTSI
jgi:hypothetical protein